MQQSKTKNHLPRKTWKIAEVAAMTGVPASTIRRRIREGKINPVVGFGPWLISDQELNRLMAQRLRGGGQS